MGKQKANWWVDVSLLAVFWITFFPDFTGLELHQWLGMAAIGLAAWHLVMHGRWVESVTLRFFSGTSFQARAYYLIDLGVMLGFFMILITGLLISTWLDLPLYDFAAWTRVHLLVSVFTLGLVILKLIYHWRWVASAVRRYAIAPLFGRAAAGGIPRPVNPVDRRDFLKVSGILGVAAVITIHSLLDDTLEAQAQSSSAEPPESNPTRMPTSDSASAPSPDTAAGLESGLASPTPVAPVSDAEPTSACIVRCPNGCAYPGSCRKYVDRNGNNYCDNGECL